MKCKILHESRGRMRVHAVVPRMTLEEADILEFYMKAQNGVRDCVVYDRTADAVITYTCPREKIIKLLSGFHYSDARKYLPVHTSRSLNREYEEKLVARVAEFFGVKLLVPMPIRMAMSAFAMTGYIKKGLESLLSGKLEVSVLDATAVTVSMVRGDLGTAASVMFLLRIGELLEEWTHKKSVEDLAGTMALNVEKVWVRTETQEVLVSVQDVKIGDLIIVRTGNMIPLDGVVEEGEAMINQASITGESLPVRKTPGGFIYAGTVVDEGECIVRVVKVSGTGRYDRIAKMIEESEKLKSNTESRASHLADRLVPYSLGGTVLTYLLARNPMKAISILMVDYSCALKLAMPLSVLSAMREAGRRNITVKGGKFMEAISEADTIVFDKTGTLTHATPKVAKIITFGGQDEKEMLRLAACLEEHYPHSIANAVVAEAKEKELEHEEKHSRVQYVVAHGIASMIDGKKVVIGSRHFVLEDEQCSIPEDEIDKVAGLDAQYSHLYLAIGGVLSAVLCIEDPIREEAPDVIRRLHELGISRIVMMTGDNRKTAEAVAARLGVDEFRAEVLPEDKAAFVKAEHEAGRKVIMIGDGVNDSPALAESDAGIAISQGAAIAREVADITIGADDLYALTELKELSNCLMERINFNYRFIMTFNTALILLGVAGFLAPATSALLHNASTIMIGLKSMTNLKDDEYKRT